MPCYLLILHVMILHISFCDCDTCITELQAHGGVCCPDKTCPDGFNSGSQLNGKCSGKGMKCCVVDTSSSTKGDYSHCRGPTTTTTSTTTLMTTTTTTTTSTTSPSRIATSAATSTTVKSTTSLATTSSQLARSSSHVSMWSSLGSMLLISTSFYVSSASITPDTTAQNDVTGYVTSGVLTEEQCRTICDTCSKTWTRDSASKTSVTLSQPTIGEDEFKIPEEERPEWMQTLGFTESDLTATSISIGTSFSFLFLVVPMALIVISDAAKIAFDIKRMLVRNVVHFINKTCKSRHRMNVQVL